MKTEKMRKLVLGRETLRQLMASEMSRAAGGGYTEDRTVCVTACFTGCITCNPSAIPRCSAAVC